MKSLILLTAVLGVMSCSHKDKTSPHDATASLNGPNVELESKIKLRDVANGVNLTADITGLKPGSIHGFHIHEKGSCVGPDFKSAGDHYNPECHTHGSPTAKMRHTGDLGNLVADKNGEGQVNMMIPDETVSSLRGKSIVLHAKADDFSSQPAGNSGDRIACGIIQ